MAVTVGRRVAPVREGTAVAVAAEGNGLEESVGMIGAGVLG